jgi:hypothetical protein
MHKNLLATIRLVACIFLMNACIPIPYKVEKPIEENDLEEITDLKAGNLQDRLGQPEVIYTIDGNKYLIYEYPPAQSDVFPLMHPVGYVFMGGLAVLLEVTIGHDSNLEVTEKGAKEWTSACMMISIEGDNPIKANVRPFDTSTDCDHVFRENILAALAEAEENGNRCAALLHSVLNNGDNAEGFSCKNCSVVKSNTGKPSIAQNPEESSRSVWKLKKEIGTYCPNAELGHANAQRHIGDLYRYGVYGLEINLIQAFVWYSLAARNGNEGVAVDLASVVIGLSPEQLKEAQGRLETWEPGHCEKDLQDSISRMQQ